MIPTAPRARAEPNCKPRASGDDPRAAAKHHGITP